MTSHGSTAIQHHHTASAHIHILGLKISDYSRHLVQEIAHEASLQTVHITSIRRSVQDQANIFYQKHVVGATRANYKNRDVAKILAHARSLYAQHESPMVIKKYLIVAIENTRGGPSAVSRHIGCSPLLEVFDVAHYGGPTKGVGRHNYMSSIQATAFLEACRKRIPYPIARLGHSEELGIKLPRVEFADEKCFHMEVQQPTYDDLEDHSGTMIA